MAEEFMSSEFGPEIRDDDSLSILIATEATVPITTPSPEARKALEEQLGLNNSNSGDGIQNDAISGEQRQETNDNEGQNLTELETDDTATEPTQPNDLAYYTDQFYQVKDQATEIYHKYKWPTLVVFVALLFSPTGRYITYCIIASLYYTALRLVAIACGIGLGLGWAAHVYDQLNHWTEKHTKRYNNNFPDMPLPARPRLNSSGRPLVRFNSNGGLPQSSNNLNVIGPNIGSGDEKSYVKLMRAAGYLVDEKLRRGQILKNFNPVSDYQFDFAGEKALTEMASRCTSLPMSVQRPLATFIEYLVRDYIGVWYSKIDPGCTYVDPETRERDARSRMQTTFGRSMVYTLALSRQMPFLDKLYKSFVTVFVNLAMRVEHVNVFELALLKWTRVLSKTFQTYRTLRQAVKARKMAHIRPASPRRNRRGGYSTVDNTTSTRDSFTERAQSANSERHVADSIPITEMEMTREFLVSGKLHRAVTFGLDCPSLLFADASGSECGPNLGNANDVLEYRLFKTGLLAECELDYNRIVAQRIVKALLPREDYSSSIISSLITELMGGCVLGPIMGLFGPLYLNGWIVAGLGGSKADTNDNKDETTAESADKLPSDTAGPGADKNNTNVATNSQLDGQNGTNVESEASEKSSKLPQVTVNNGNEIECVKNGMSSRALLDIPEANSQTSSPTTIAATSVTTPAAAVEVSGTSVVNDVVSGISNNVPAKIEGISGDEYTMQLSLALIDLQRYADFDECRHARENNGDDGVDWYSPDCQEASLKLVLIVEAALSDGRCTYRESKVEKMSGFDVEGENDSFDDLDESEQAVEVSLPDYESVTLSQILMEMTSDIEAFEERVARENAMSTKNKAAAETDQDDAYVESYKPTDTEQSTLRTLIAAWLHSGQIFRVISVLIQAHATVLSPYYTPKAFLRNASNSSGFVRQLRSLDGVGVLVDTMTVLASPRLDEAIGDELKSLVKKTNNRVEAIPQKNGIISSSKVSSLAAATAAYMAPTSSTARHMNFHANETFASSLRAERERRTQSWNQLFADDTDEGLPIVCSHKKRTEHEMAMHRELHILARIFYTGTNLISIRDAARKRSLQDVDVASQSEQSDTTDAPSTTILTVETACQRRKIEIPDDDSSFLLRAQPRPLNAIGVHRDQRNHDQSYKCFAATYEEPAVSVGSEHFNGGKFIRHCLIRYYPIDRTATVALQGDMRRLDQRKHKGSIPNTITVGHSKRSTPFLSTDFLRERHLCQRWNPKGTARSQSLLSSNVMEPTDFTSSPRSGKAIEFVYKLNFFERPVINLGGNHFTVQDSSILGPHKADGSSIEMSDASLSLALLSLTDTQSDTPSVSAGKHELGIGRDGYPILWMKFSRKQDDTNVEVKPYRLSYIRAALLIMSARQEAQLQSLLVCVRAGSAKKATKALTDLRLKPALRLLDYASSVKKEKETLLLRDLKLGVNHIDRDQLRRNGLLCPRYPTELLELRAVVEDSVQAEETHEVGLQGATGTYYRVRCTAKCRLMADESEMYDVASYRNSDGNLCQLFEEQWVVYRSFKDFQTLHKHLKNEVSTSESSGTTGSRLVGAASAAFTVNTLPGRHRQRKALIPSMSQATKVGALGMTKKSLQKRQECLNDYISYYLSSGHLMNRCSEILLFLGAFYPLPPTVLIGETMSGIPDPLGRSEMSRTNLQGVDEESDDDDSTVPPESIGVPNKTGGMTREVSHNSVQSFTTKDDAADDMTESINQKDEMIPAIRSKIDKVPLPLVRNRIFELIRFQFGFDNASFVRGRMLTALKTASFAVTSQIEFRKLLYSVHTQHLSADAVSGYIQLVVDLLWPNGVFFTSAPPLTEAEIKSQEETARVLLHNSFPDALRTILGQELTRDGLDMFHEMLQNRLVVKSMAYMLFDLLWIQVFPEIGDILACGTALDIDIE